MGKKTKISARLDAVIQADIESSKRYWQEVKKHAEERLANPDRYNSHKRAQYDLTKAEHALTELDFGRTVSIWNI